MGGDLFEFMVTKVEKWAGEVKTLGQYATIPKFCIHWPGDFTLVGMEFVSVGYHWCQSLHGAVGGSTDRGLPVGDLR